MKTIEIDGKRYELFCECNDVSWPEPEKNGSKCIASSGSHICRTCNMWKWIYPNRPLKNEPDPEKPWAMIPDYQGKMIKVVFGETALEFKDRVHSEWTKEVITGYDISAGYAYRKESTCYDQACLPLPNRPEIAIDEPVWTRNFIDTEWLPSNFAGWCKNKPLIWCHGATSHTTTYKAERNCVKTKSGQIWPPEKGE